MDNSHINLKTEPTSSSSDNVLDLSSRSRTPSLPDTSKLVDISQPLDLSLGMDKPCSTKRKSPWSPLDLRVTVKRVKVDDNTSEEKPPLITSSIHSSSHSTRSDCKPINLSIKSDEAKISENKDGSESDDIPMIKHDDSCSDDSGSMTESKNVHNGKNQSLLLDSSNTSIAHRASSDLPTLSTDTTLSHSNYVEIPSCVVLPNATQIDMPDSCTTIGIDANRTSYIYITSKLAGSNQASTHDRPSALSHEHKNTKHIQNIDEFTLSDDDSSLNDTSLGLTESTQPTDEPLMSREDKTHTNLITKSNTPEKGTQLSKAKQTESDTILRTNMTDDNSRQKDSTQATTATTHPEHASMKSSVLGYKSHVISTARRIVHRASKFSKTGTAVASTTGADSDGSDWVTDEEDSLQIDMEAVDIDTQIHAKAVKTNMSRRHVKAMIREVVTNKDVIEMVKNTLADSLETAPAASFEPKMTRARIKEQVSPVAVWPITPVKKPSDEPRFLDMLFSESEDDEYQPDLEAAEDSGEDSESVASSRAAEDSGEDSESVASSRVSEFGSPLPSTPVTPATSHHALCDLLDASMESVTPKSVSHDTSGMAPPMDYVRGSALGKKFQSAMEEDAKIATRTRSKMPLTDTSILELEESFIAPDITPDMYDTNVDDGEWTDFLNSLHRIPLTAPEAVDPLYDESNDPEYNFLQEAESEELDTEDYRFDKSVKITKKELGELFDELLAAYGDPEITDYPPVIPVIPRQHTKRSPDVTASTSQLKGPVPVIEAVPPNTSDAVFTPELSLRLQQQMRKHVQLLCQTYVMTRPVPGLQTIADTCHTFVNELENLGTTSTDTHGVVSHFCALNLPPALDLLNVPLVEEGVARSTRRRKSRGFSFALPLSMTQKKLLFTSRAFVYPDLLPINGFIPEHVETKLCFSDTETRLIAWGLQQWHEHFPKETNLTKVSEFIHTYMLPVKSAIQIKQRIKNRSTQASQDNPINEQRKNKRVDAVVDIVEPFDETRLVAPKDTVSIDVLPDWALEGDFLQSVMNDDMTFNPSRFTVARDNRIPSNKAKACVLFEKPKDETAPSIADSTPTLAPSIPLKLMMVGTEKVYVSPVISQPLLPSTTDTHTTPKIIVIGSSYKTDTTNFTTPNVVENVGRLGTMDNISSVNTANIHTTIPGMSNSPNVFSAVSPMDITNVNRRNVSSEYTTQNLSNAVTPNILGNVATMNNISSNNRQTPTDQTNVIMSNVTTPNILSTGNSTENIPIDIEMVSTRNTPNIGTPNIVTPENTFPTMNLIDNIPSSNSTDNTPTVDTMDDSTLNTPKVTPISFTDINSGDTTIAKTSTDHLTNNETGSNILQQSVLSTPLLNVSNNDIVKDRSIEVDEPCAIPFTNFTESLVSTPTSSKITSENPRRNLRSKTKLLDTDHNKKNIIDDDVKVVKISPKDVEKKPLECRTVCEGAIKANFTDLRKNKKVFQVNMDMTGNGSRECIVIENDTPERCNNITVTNPKAHTSLTPLDKIETISSTSDSSKNESSETGRVGRTESIDEITQKKSLQEHEHTEIPNSKKLQRSVDIVEINEHSSDKTEDDLPVETVPGKDVTVETTVNSPIIVINIPDNSGSDEITENCAHDIISSSEHSKITADDENVELFCDESLSSLESQGRPSPSEGRCSPPHELVSSSIISDVGSSQEEEIYDRMDVFSEVEIGDHLNHTDNSDNDITLTDNPTSNTDNMDGMITDDCTDSDSEIVEPPRLSSESNTDITTNVKDTFNLNPVASPCTNSNDRFQRTVSSPCANSDRFQRTVSSPCANSNDRFQRAVSSPCANSNDRFQRTVSSPCANSNDRYQRTVSSPCANSNDRFQRIEDVSKQGLSVNVLSPAEFIVHSTSNSPNPKFRQTETETEVCMTENEVHLHENDVQITQSQVPVTETSSEQPQTCTNCENSMDIQTEVSQNSGSDIQNSGVSSTNSAVDFLTAVAPYFTTTKKQPENPTTIPLHKTPTKRTSLFKHTSPLSLKYPRFIKAKESCSPVKKLVFDKKQRKTPGSYKMKIHTNILPRKASPRKLQQIRAKSSPLKRAFQEIRPKPSLAKRLVPEIAPKRRSSPRFAQSDECTTTCEDTAEVREEKGERSKVESDDTQSDEDTTQPELEHYDSQDEEMDRVEKLMQASTTIRMLPKRYTSKVKRVKETKQLETTLSLLRDDILETDPLRTERDATFVQSYLLKVKDAFSGDESKYEQFITILHEFGQLDAPVTLLYDEVASLFRDHPDLLQHFSAFLLPHQAVQCGCFMDYQAFLHAKTFLRKLEIYMESQHQNTFHKVMRTLTTPSRDLRQLKECIRPLCRGQKHLLEEFSKFFPDEAPPNSEMVDFEEINLPNLSTDSADIDDHETLTMPDDQLMGTKMCQCKCHDDTDHKMAKRICHCNSCALKVIGGKIYFHTGHRIMNEADIIYHKPFLMADLMPPEVDLAALRERFKQSIENRKSSKSNTTETSSIAPPRQQPSSEFGQSQNVQNTTKETEHPQTSNSKTAPYTVTTKTPSYTATTKTPSYTATKQTLSQYPTTPEKSLSKLHNFSGFLGSNDTSSPMKDILAKALKYAEVTDSDCELSLSSSNLGIDNIDMFFNNPRPFASVSLNNHVQSTEVINRDHTNNTTTINCNTPIISIPEISGQMTTDSNINILGTDVSSYKHTPLLPNNVNFVTTESNINTLVTDNTHPIYNVNVVNPNIVTNESHCAPLQANPNIATNESHCAPLQANPNMVTNESRCAPLQANPNIVTNESWCAPLQANVVTTSFTSLLNNAIDSCVLEDTSPKKSAVSNRISTSDISCLVSTSDAPHFGFTSKNSTAVSSVSSNTIVESVGGNAVGNRITDTKNIEKQLEFDNEIPRCSTSKAVACRIERLSGGDSKNSIIEKHVLSDTDKRSDNIGNSEKDSELSATDIIHERDREINDKGIETNKDANNVVVTQCSSTTLTQPQEENSHVHIVNIETVDESSCGFNTRTINESHCVTDGTIETVAHTTEPVSNTLFQNTKTVEIEERLESNAMDTGKQLEISKTTSTEETESTYLGIPTSDRQKVPTHVEQIMQLPSDGQIMNFECVTVVRHEQMNEADETDVRSSDVQRCDASNRSSVGHNVNQERSSDGHSETRRSTEEHSSTTDKPCSDGQGHDGGDEYSDGQATLFGCGDASDGKMVDEVPPVRVVWTKDEDRLLLEMCKDHGEGDEAVARCLLTLTHRTHQQVSLRLRQLMALICNISGSSENGDTSSEDDNG